MLLVIHITLSVVSIFVSLFNTIKPTKRKFNLTYTSSVATIVSGAIISAYSGTTFGQSCLKGLLFLALVGVLTWNAKQRQTRILLSHS